MLCVPLTFYYPQLLLIIPLMTSYLPVLTLYKVTRSTHEWHGSKGHPCPQMPAIQVLCICLIFFCLGSREIAPCDVHRAFTCAILFVGILECGTHYCTHFLNVSLRSWVLLGVSCSPGCLFRCGHLCACTAHQPSTSPSARAWCQEEEHY